LNIENSVNGVTSQNNDISAFRQVALRRILDMSLTRHTACVNHPAREEPKRQSTAPLLTAQGGLAETISAPQASETLEEDPIAIY